MEPLPKQGCEIAPSLESVWEEKSQWNPCRSRGARSRCQVLARRYRGLSGTPAEAGVRAECSPKKRQRCTRLSGTPAEAGVRGSGPSEGLRKWSRLSGTPAEAGVRGAAKVTVLTRDESQWNPCRSRGARRRTATVPPETQGLSGTPAEAGVRACGFSILCISHSKSQWNPCRSRGARRSRRMLCRRQLLVSVEPLPKQGCEVILRARAGQSRKVSVEPLPKQGCERPPV